MKLLTIFAACAGALAGWTGCASSAPSTGSSPPVAVVTPAAPSLTSAQLDALLAAPDRSPADRKLDAGRQPKDLLAFFGVGPGTRVGEVGAWTGYTSELLARAVGPTGKVYGQNTPALLAEEAEGPWSARLAKPVNRNIVREDAPFEAPFPGVTGLDLVIDVLFYHDTVWLGVDRDKMNRAVFAALRPGGAYIIVDHSAKAGHGLADVQTLHRIDQKTLEAEVEKAGFTLAASGHFLEHPADTRDWNDSDSAAGERRGTSDRFVLRFVKP